MEIKNMFLIDYNGAVTVMKNYKQVDFDSKEEFSKYTEGKYTNIIKDKTYLCYMPDDKVLTDKITGESWISNIKPYDDIIELFPVLEQRKDDPLYGLYGTALIKKKAEVDILNAKLECYKNLKEPVQIDLSGSVFSMNGGKASVQDISNEIRIAELDGSETVELWDINNIIHEFTLEQAKQIVIQISKYNKEHLFKLQSEKVRLNNIIKECSES